MRMITGSAVSPFALMLLGGGRRREARHSSSKKSLNNQCLARKIVLVIAVNAFAVRRAHIVAEQVRRPDTKQVRVTVTAGSLGLGLSLAEEGSRCMVKGFRPMPDGQPNPGQVGVEELCCMQGDKGGVRGAGGWG